MERITITKYDEGIIKYASWNKRISIYKFNIEDSVSAIELINKSNEHGVYILKGTDPETDKTTFYVGEGQDVARRSLKSSQIRKWVNEVVWIMSSNSQMLFDKSQVQYLESQLIDVIRSIPLSSVDDDNANKGQGEIFDNDITMMLNNEVDEIRSALHRLGWYEFHKSIGDVLKSLPEIHDIREDMINTIKEYNATEFVDSQYSIDVYFKGIKYPTVDVKGKFYPHSNNLLMQKGSKGNRVVKEASKIEFENYLMKLPDYFNVNYNKETGDYSFNLTEDHLFNKPSPAGWIVVGGYNDGYITFKEVGTKKRIKFYKKKKEI